MTETALVQRIIAVVKGGGGDAWHVHGSSVQRAGEPDIDGAYRVTDSSWIHFKVECKVGTNEASPLQEHRLERWGRMGYATGVVRSVDDFLRLMENAYQRGLHVRLEHDTLPKHE